MTRDNLRALEGSLVYYKGRAITGRATTADGLSDLMLNNVSIWVFDEHQPISYDPAPAAKLDHVWIRSRVVAEQEKVELLEQLSGLARVTWYRRTNNTTDLGLSVVPSIVIEHLWHESDQCSTMTDALRLIEQRLQEAKRRGAAHISFQGSCTEMHQKILDHLTTLKRSQAEWDRISATAHRGPKPKSAKSFADLHRQEVRSCQ